VSSLRTCARLECWWALNQRTVMDCRPETIWHCPARGVVLATFDKKTKGRLGGNHSDTNYSMLITGRQFINRLDALPIKCADKLLGLLHQFSIADKDRYSLVKMRRLHIEDTLSPSGCVPTCLFTDEPQRRGLIEET